MLKNIFILAMFAIVWLLFDLFHDVRFWIHCCREAHGGGSATEVSCPKRASKAAGKFAGTFFSASPRDVRPDFARL